MLNSSGYTPARKFKDIGNMKIAVGQQKMKVVKAIAEKTSKHRSSLNTYIDSEGRSRLSLSHRIRLNKKWSLKFSGTMRGSNRRNNQSFNTSIIRNW